jgi:hypothetical protein
MSYHYYQLGVAADEKWKPVKADKLDTIDGAMFCTVLSVDVPIADDASKEDLAGVKYRGSLYFDLDDATSPASTAKYAMELVGKLEQHGVPARQLELYASGGKGFHILVPEECFLTKPPKSGMAFLPAIYKEMAFDLAVPSLDFRVYTARKGRMFRRANVERPNGLYKVRISAEELATLAEIADKDEAEAAYKQMCSAPRRALDVESDLPELATGLMALFDQSKAKVSKAANRSKKKRTVTLPKEMPSFEALLRGEGIKPDTGFHQIAMQVAITAHARNMSREDLLSAAAGLCENHQSDGYRYNTASKRRAELARMWEYTDDNPCYEYSPGAVTSLLTHTAPDLHGLTVTEEEVSEAITEAGESPAAEDAGEFGHAGLIMTRQGAFTLTENGPKMVTAVSFDNVTELVSAEDNRVTVVEADVYVAGRRVSHGTPMELESFNSVSSVNKLLMRHGQAFSGNDVQARGLYLRMIEKARKANRRMYVSNREGLDLIKIPGHENETVRKGFMVWSDNRGVAVQPAVVESGVQMKFVGFPDPHGQYQTDIEDAPKLVEWLKDEDGLNKESLRVFLKDLLACQSPSHVGKLLGWMVAAYWRMLFHEKYDKFPLLHINGAAGQGKTETTKLFCNLHYYNTEPKMLTPNSTLFAVSSSIAGSSSIPLVLDEFKPAEMNPQIYDKFKLLLRDAYNCRAVERGGGTRESNDYRSVHRTQLAAPLIFISEAAESESALMERVVLLTQIKPPAIQMAENYMRFSRAVEKKEYLGILGKYIAAGIIKRTTMESFTEEFNTIYNATRKELMLSADDVDLSPEMLMKKSGAKERTVFNYSVVRFGLMKFERLISGIFGDEFAALFKAMQDTACSSVDDIQSQTVPEWLKVLNTFTDMAHLDPESPCFLVKGKDYAEVEYGGEACMEFNLRSCYHKYRQYMAISRSKPLFPGESAFVFAMGNTPALVAKQAQVDLLVPGGSHVFKLAELRSSGYLAP